MVKAPRPFGISSRFIRTEGPHRQWTTGEVTVDLPVIVDWVNVDPDTGEEIVRIEARVDLIGDTPEVVKCPSPPPPASIWRYFSAISAGLHR